MLLLHGTGQEPCPMLALAPAVLGIWVISPSSLLFPSPPPPLVPIINKRMTVYVMKQVVTEFTRERYHQDNSLTVPIVLYLYVCFTAGCAKRSSWPTKCGVDTAPANPRARGYRGSGASQTYRILKFVLGSFGPDSLLLTEGSTLRDLGINMLIIIRGQPLNPFAGGGVIST
jgi:hypothetical protein